MQRTRDGLVPLISGEMAKNIIEFFVYKCGIFSAGGIFYKQEKGLMMGSSLSSVIAALIIEDTLSKIAGGIGSKTILMLYAVAVASFRPSKLILRKCLSLLKRRNVVQPTHINSPSGISK